MSQPPGRHAPAAIERMANAARAFVEALSAEQRQQATFPFPGDDERTTWFYTPTDHGGLCLRDMDPPQQRLAHMLLASGLSPSGYNTAATIIGLENVLDVREGGRATFASDAGRGRDPNFYYVAIFGEPGAESGWGWRFGGHHVSVNYTLIGNDLRHLPLFFGANPAVYSAGSQALRPLGPEMDLGRKVLDSLESALQRRAIISPAAPDDIVTSNRPAIEPGNRPRPPWEIFRGTMGDEHRESRARRQELFVTSLGLSEELYTQLALPEEPKGVPGIDMHFEARLALQDLVDEFTARLPEDGALPLAPGLTVDDVYFAWAGSTEPGQPHYWRLHAPRLLIEYDCVQDRANHVHTVWRDPVADFGRDLLAEHYAKAH